MLLPNTRRPDCMLLHNTRRPGYLLLHDTRRRWPRAATSNSCRWPRVAALCAADLTATLLRLIVADDHALLRYVLSTPLRCTCGPGCRCYRCVIHSADDRALLRLIVVSLPMGREILVT